MEDMSHVVGDKGTVFITAPNAEALEKYQQQQRAMMEDFRSRQSRRGDLNTAPQHECEVRGCKNIAGYRVTHAKFKAQGDETDSDRYGLPLPPDVIAGGPTVGQQIENERHWTCFTHYEPAMRNEPCNSISPS